MNVALPRRLTVDQFLAWAVRQPEGKYELVDGVVVMQQSQKWGHSKVKAAVYVALMNAVARDGVACYVAIDGPTVRIGRHRAFVPDALVAALPEPDWENLEVPDPIIVVEVRSPSTARMDETTKLEGYFQVASVRHYLIVDPDARTITHHRRGRGGTLTRRVVRKGTLALKPPGIEIALADVFGRART
jgi:Uma2 family endonuclease